MNAEVHIVPLTEYKGKRKWAVTRGRFKRYFITQGAAIKRGKDLAINKKTELVVHGEDGKIQWKNSYGSDSHPPRG